jgi:hypothetical protein
MFESPRCCRLTTGGGVNQENSGDNTHFALTDCQRRKSALFPPKSLEFPGIVAMGSGDRPPDQTRVVLKTRLSYLHLATALLPELFKQDDVRGAVNELAAIIDSTSTSHLQLRAHEILCWLDTAIAMANGRLHPRKAREDIAADYWQLNSGRQISHATGIDYGWLACRFDLTAALGVPDDLPYHARIGLANHAGTAAIEEDFLLRDSFYLLAKLRQQFDWLQRHVAMPKARPAKDSETVSAMLAHNVAGFARLTVKSFYSFLECFINSVGEDFIAREGGLTPLDKECLRGKKKGSYLRLDAKIERFPGIIRSDRKRPLVLSDPAQIREPFVALRRITQLRDAAMHYAREKEPIWRSPQDWKEMAEFAGKTCVACAREFWIACYPSRPLPKYLHEFDEVRHGALAQQRLDLELAVAGQMGPPAMPRGSGGVKRVQSPFRKRAKRVQPPFPASDRCYPIA